MDDKKIEHKLSTIQSKVSSALKKANESVELLNEASAMIEQVYIDLPTPNLTFVQRKETTNVDNFREVLDKK